MSQGFTGFYPLPWSVGNGGTGLATLALHAVLIGAGTNPITAAVPGTAGQVLVSNGPSADPSFQSLVSGNVVTVPGTNSVFGTTLAAALRGLDPLAQPKVISASTAAQPGSPADGDTYLLPTGSTGAAWAGNDGKIARYSTVAVAWEFFTPQNGWETYAQDTGIRWYRVSAAWTSSLVIAATTDITLGTTASGAVQVSGGATFAKSLQVQGPILSVGPGSASSGNGGSLQIRDDTGTFRWQVGLLGTPGATVYNIYDQVNTASRLTIDNAGKVTVVAATSATSTTTGSFNVNGGMGVAGAIYAGATINSTYTDTSTSGTVVGLTGFLTANPAATSTAQWLGGNFSSSSSASCAQTLTSASGALIGGSFAAQHFGSALLTLGIGGNFTANVRLASGGATSMMAAQFQANNLSANTVPALYCINIMPIGNSGGGTVTTGYGLYVGAQTAAGTNYAIYTNAGLVRIGDVTTITATTASGTGGFAPTITLTATSGGSRGSLALGIYSPGSASTATYISWDCRMQTSIAANGGTLIGMNGETRLNSGSTGTYSTAYGVQAGVNNQSAATVTTAYALYVASNTNTGGGAITTGVGVYVAAQTAGGTNYAIFTNAGLVSIGDSTASTTTTTGAVVITGGMGLGGSLFMGGATLNQSASSSGSVLSQVTNTSNGVGSDARSVLQNDTGVQTLFALGSSTNTGTFFTLTRASTMFIGSGSASIAAIVVGSLTANVPVVFGTNAAEVMRLVTAGLNMASGKVYQVNGNQVVAARKTGWTPWTGTATRTSFATSTATLQNVAEALKALIDDLHQTAGHGLIGT